MLSRTVKSIFPFVPAKDFEVSTRFYKDLGFTCPSEDEDVRCFKLGACGFLIQDYYVQDWADNFMMNLHVDDVEQWHRHIVESKLTERYPDSRVSPPKLEDWGMIVMHLVDPTGVLWHVTQKPDGTS